MATGLVGFVGPIVGPIAGIGQFLMAPVGRHFGYLFSYKSKVKNLNDEVKKLDEKRGAMQLAVDEAERNVKVIGPDVKGWLERVDKCSEEAREILKDEVEANKWCLCGWCPNLLLRYSLGKKATNKAKEVAKLHEERKLTEVAYRKPSPWIESTSTEGIKDFESRLLITNVLAFWLFEGYFCKCERASKDQSVLTEIVIANQLSDDCVLVLFSLNEEDFYWWLGLGEIKRNNNNMKNN